VNDVTVAVGDRPEVAVSVPARPGVGVGPGQAAAAVFYGTKFSGIGPPGTIPNAVAGDLYRDTRSGAIYERTVNPAGYLRCNNVANSGAWCPDIAAIAGAFRLDVFCTLMPDNWVQPTGTIVSQWGNLADPTMSWALYLMNTGSLRFDARSTTPGTLSYGQGAPFAAATGLRRSIATRFATQSTVANHSAWHTADGVNIGGAFGTGAGMTTGLRDSPGRIVIGAMGDTMNSGNYFAGRISRLILRANDLVIASPDFTKLAPGATSFTDAQGNLWTIAAAASIASDVGYWRLVGNWY